MLSQDFFISDKYRNDAVLYKIQFSILILLIISYLRIYFVQFISEGSRHVLRSNFVINASDRGVQAECNV